MDKKSLEIYEKFKMKCGSGGMSKERLFAFVNKNNFSENEIKQLIMSGYIVEKNDLYYPNK